MAYTPRASSVSGKRAIRRSLSQHDHQMPARTSHAPNPAATQSEPSITPEDPTPMLDVHPAHHAASTWRDFFIHIATIALGLLLAVGLEQGVEVIHHRHEANHARELIA